MQIKKPLISVITVCFNSEKTITKTILSVLNQTYKNIEYIIIDGGSTDNTVNIIKSFTHLSPGVHITNNQQKAKSKKQKAKNNQISYWTSEKDSGIYNAMNKGLKVATGDYIQFLNSDDEYVSSNVIENVVSQIKNEQVYYGNVIFVDKYNFKYRVGGVINKNKEIYRPYKMHQPAMFVPNNYYKNIGYLLENYKIAADYEMNGRLIKAGFNFQYIDIDILNLNAGGASDIQAIKSYKEVYSISTKILKKNKVKASSIFIYWCIKYFLQKYFNKQYKFLRKHIKHK